MYDRILVPLENSPADDTILAHVRPLARIHNSSLVLIHVADGWAARNQEQLNLTDSEEIVQDRAYLERRRAELAGEGFGVTAFLGKGDPTREIVAAAERERCDLIAMTTHGHRWLQDLLRGSVASDVRHRTEVPVLLVRQRS
jgi:nucleotide-binding universal stress UspA family protein